MTSPSPNDEPQQTRGVTPIQTADDLTAVIYARTSSPSQRHGYSLGEQVRQCWSRCEQLGWTVSHVYRDEAVSGKNTDREMFQKLLTGAEAGWFDVVIIWKLDRFSRSLMHAVQLERDLRKWDVGLHSVTEHIDTTTPTGRFNFRNISSASEFERDMIKQRSQMGLQAMAEERKWPNDTPPLGYNRKENGRLEIDDAEASLVEQIFRRYLVLKSMPTLADELLSKDAPDCRDKAWTPYAVGKVLKNELYIGQYSVADVDAYVDEYRILESALFEEVTSVRTRFQTDKAAGRPPMPVERKERNLEKITSQYVEYLSITEENPSS